MTTRIDALVLCSDRATETIAFYQALGIPLEDESHDDGEVHAACDLGGAHIAVYDNNDPKLIPGGGTMIGFHVDSLDEILRTMKAAGAEIAVDPQDVPWGRRAVIRDPEGRLIELNEG